MPSISLQFPLSTIMVMDNHVNGVPVAWYVASNEQESTIDQVLAAFKATVEAEDPTWRPSCFVVDDAAATINVIR